MAEEARDERKAQVGAELRARREALNLSQDELARNVGGSRRSVTATENGESAVQLRKREAWEQVLRLQPGAISRAYRDGTPLAVAEEVDRDEPHLSGLEQRPGEDDVAYAHRLLEAAMGLLRKHDSEQRGA